MNRGRRAEAIFEGEKDYFTFIDLYEGSGGFVEYACFRLLFAKKSLSYPGPDP